MLTSALLAHAVDLLFSVPHGDKHEEFVAFKKKVADHLTDLGALAEERANGPTPLRTVEEQSRMLRDKLLGTETAHMKVLVVDRDTVDVFERFVREWTTQEGCGSEVLDGLAVRLASALKLKQ